MIEVAAINQLFHHTKIFNLKRRKLLKKLRVHNEQNIKIVTE